MIMYFINEEEYEQIKEDARSLIDERFEYLDGIKDDERSKRIVKAVGGYNLKDFTDREWFCLLLGLRDGMGLAEEGKC